MFARRKALKLIRNSRHDRRVVALARECGMHRYANGGGAMSLCFLKLSLSEANLPPKLEALVQRELNRWKGGKNHAQA